MFTLNLPGNISASSWGAAWGPKVTPAYESPTRVPESSGRGGIFDRQFELTIGKPSPLRGELTGRYTTKRRLPAGQGRMDRRSNDFRNEMASCDGRRECFILDAIRMDYHGAAPVITPRYGAEARCWSYAVESQRVAQIDKLSAHRTWG